MLTFLTSTSDQDDLLLEGLRVLPTCEKHDYLVHVRTSQGCKHLVLNLKDCDWFDRCD